MEVVNISDKRKTSKVDEFFNKNTNDLSVKEAIIMTSMTVFVTGIVTVSINTAVNAIQAFVDARRS